jgi:hypothetical protein
MNTRLKLHEKLGGNELDNPKSIIPIMFEYYGQNRAYFKALIGFVVFITVLYLIKQTFLHEQLFKIFGHGYYISIFGMMYVGYSVFNRRSGIFELSIASTAIPIYTSGLIASIFLGNSGGTIGMGHAKIAASFFDIFVGEIGKNGVNDTAWMLTIIYFAVVLYYLYTLADYPINRLTRILVEIATTAFLDFFGYEEEKENYAKNEPSKPSKPIVATTRGIELGVNDNGVTVNWQYDNNELANRHLVVLGGSGQGKTYLLQKLLMLLAKANGRSNIIVDFKPSFLNKDVEPAFKKSGIENHYIANEPLNINPFARGETVIDEGLTVKDSEYDVAGRVTSVFMSVFGSMGEQQQSTLTRAIESGINQYGDMFNFSLLSQELKRVEIEYLDNGSEKEIEYYKGGQLIANKIEPLVRQNPFESGVLGWEEMYSGVANQVMQLHGIDDTIKKIVADFILWDLYRYLNFNSTKQTSHVICVDECQNIKFNERSPAFKILKEGRQFGMSLILATQDLVKFTNDERAALSQAGTMIMFQPPESAKRDFAKILESRSTESIKYWMSQLSDLRKGQCFLLHLNRIEKVNVSAITTQ